MMKYLIAAAAVATLAAPVSANAVVGQPAPAFTAKDSNGKSVSLADFKGKPVVLEWTNADCPFVQKHYSSGNMQSLQADARKSGAVWLTVNSGAPGKQGHVTGAEANAKVKAQGFGSTAYLLDTDGAIGRAYGAKTTPHMYVIAPDGKLAYAGGIDDVPTANPADIAKARPLVKLALADVQAGKAVETPTSRPYGCSVKY
ncbi:thioredoxin family protein [Sandaracinobacter sp. RS1-74]|uniref:thioredoxin family protein n=1 Tax=Sandaracinobacteroides sayramensis TaxID=2913411 RepID=UPI001EDABDB4|nr:thioredoxin family protein [Sandaracinobacteroides sayramensis]MCG2841000.1 thioredoxin family protein [Sandaracinobacteroides sayramensis]